MATTTDRAIASPLETRLARETREEAERQAEHAANWNDLQRRQISNRRTKLEKLVSDLKPWHSLLLNLKERAESKLASLPMILKKPTLGEKDYEQKLAAYREFNQDRQHEVRVERQNLEATLVAINQGPSSYESRWSAGDGYFEIWTREAGVHRKEFKRGLMRTEKQLAELQAELDSLS